MRRILAGASPRLLVDKMVDECHALAAAPTAREREVLRGFARGENDKILAERIGVSATTVPNHLTIRKDKLGLREPAELVHYAIKHGYVEAP